MRAIPLLIGAGQRHVGHGAINVGKPALSQDGCGLLE
jgi:hypothetical protein